MQPSKLQAFLARVKDQLEKGDFRYVLVAERFSPTMLQTLDYMNSTTSGFRFYAVELVRFQAQDASAFEARTVVQPPIRQNWEKLNETTFLEAVVEHTYREALGTFFEVCRGLGLRFQWGPSGTSIRVRTPYRPEPVSLAWVFPPSGGWLGLRYVTLGYDTNTGRTVPSMLPDLDSYVDDVGRIQGGRR